MREKTSRDIFFASLPLHSTYTRSERGKKA